MIKEHTLFTERFRPTDPKDYIGNEVFKSSLDQWIKQQDIPHILLYGPAGTGKTTAAKLITANLDCDSIYINCSDENGIETIREKVKSFASAATFRALKVVIMDEADFLTINAQAALRNVIESFSKTTRFVFTCNYVERIIDPIQSRCQTLKIVPPSKEDIIEHLVKILTKENISFDSSDVISVVNSNYPDVRKMLNIIQMSTIDGGQNDLYLRIDKDVIVSSNYMNKVLNELKKPRPDWKSIRQIIINANVSDFEVFYRFLYDNASKYLDGKEGMVAIYVNEYSYQANFRIDKEINIMALISKLIELK